MIIPIRCMTCGKPIAQSWESFLQKTENRKKHVKETMDELGLERACCRSFFLGHVDLIDDIAGFKKD